jgi:hypothetical protein
MRITVDIPDSLYQELKTKAAREKRPVKELILRGVENEVALRKAKKTRRVIVPLIRSKQPGTLEINNKKINDLLSFP